MTRDTRLEAKITLQICVRFCFTYPSKPGSRHEKADRSLAAIHLRKPSYIENSEARIPCLKDKAHQKENNLKCSEL